MPRPTPIIIPGPTGMGGSFTEKTPYDINGLLNGLSQMFTIYHQITDPQKNVDAAKAAASMLGMDKQQGASVAGQGAATGDTGYAVKEQPAFDINALAKAPLGQQMIMERFKTLFGPMTMDKYLAQQVQGGKMGAGEAFRMKQGPLTSDKAVAQMFQTGDVAGATQLAGLKRTAGRDYTQTKVLKDLSGKTGDYLVYKYNPESQAYDIPQGQAQPNWAQQQQVGAGDIKSLGDSLAEGRMDYDQVQRNLQRSVKAQTDLVRYMEKNHPGFNFVKSSAARRFAKGQNLQGQIRFIDTLVGDPQSGQPGTLDLAISLKDQVDKEIGSSGVPVIDAKWINAARLAGGNSAAAKYANTLYDVAREKARAAAGTGATVTDAQTQQEMDKTYIGYTTDQISDIMNNEKGVLLMRRHSMTKDTAYDMGSWDDVEQRYFGGQAPVSDRPSLFQDAFSKGDKKVSGRSSTAKPGAPAGKAAGKYGSMSNDEIKKQLGL